MLLSEECDPLSGNYCGKKQVIEFANVRAWETCLSARISEKSSAEL